MSKRWLARTALGVGVWVSSSGLAAAAPEKSAPAGEPNRPGARAELAAHLFQRMDTDRDGKVTRTEADAAGQRLFENLDRDRDGTVAREEAEAGASELRQRELAVHFARLDQNHDGRLTRAESQLPQRRFEQLDTNSDRALSLAEFQNQPDPGAAHRRLELERADANRDGKVSREEAQRVLAERFARVDADRDGTLTRSELEAHVAQLQAGPGHEGHHGPPR